MVMVHDDGRFSQADAYVVRSVFGTHAQGFDFRRDIGLIGQPINRSRSPYGTLHIDIIQRDKTVGQFEGYVVQPDIRSQGVGVEGRRFYVQADIVAAQVFVVVKDAVYFELSVAVQVASFAIEGHA